MFITPSRKLALNSFHDTLLKSSDIKMEKKIQETEEIRNIPLCWNLTVFYDIVIEVNSKMNDVQCFCCLGISDG